MYLLSGGVMPKHYVRQTCGNPACVRPSHLYETTESGAGRPATRGLSELPPVPVKEIRNLLDDGWTIGELAERYECTRAAIVNALG
jgi:uncharacterized protein (DUF433 family)